MRPAGWALLLWGLNLALGSLYALSTPPYEASDEQWHVPYVLALADGAGLPVQRPGTQQPWRQEGSQPPLYYALAALLSFGVDTSDRSSVLLPNPHPDIGRLTRDGNVAMAVHRPGEGPGSGGLLLAVALSRGASLLLASFTVPLTYLLARSTLPASPWAAVAAAALVATNPMFLFIQGSVNNDNLVIPLVTLTLYLLVDGLRREAPVRRALAVGLAAGLAGLAKVSGAGLLVLAALAAIHRRSPARGALALGAAGATCGWWYLRNQLLYGEPTGLAVMVAVAGGRHPRPSLLQLAREWWGAFMSYWGFFGGMNLAAPEWFYRLALALSLAGLAGFLLWLGRRRRVEPALLLLWLWLGLNLAGLVRWSLATLASQGRLLFPSIAVLSLLLAVGLLQLWPGRPQRGAAVLAGGLALLAAWLPLGVIRPAYRPPAALAGPPPAQGRPVELGGEARLLGWRLELEELRVGEELPVTLWWQAAEEMETDYSLFIHLVAENQTIAGQRDLYPGLGSYPTSAWVPGRGFSWTYHVPVPEGTQAPAVLEVLAGLYRLDTGERLPVEGGGDSVRLGSVRLLPVGDSPYPNPMRAVLGERVALVGYRLEPAAASAGETVTLILYWQALRPMERDYTVFTHVLGEGQHIWGQEDRAAATSRWVPGQVQEEVYRLHLHPNTPPGTHQVEVGMYRPDTLERLELVGPHGQVQGNRILLGSLGVR